MADISKINAFLYAKARKDHPEMSAREISKLVRTWRNKYLAKAR